MRAERIKDEKQATINLILLMLADTYSGLDPTLTDYRSSLATNLASSTFLTVRQVNRLLRNSGLVTCRRSRDCGDNDYDWRLKDDVRKGLRHSLNALADQWLTKVKTHALNWELGNKGMRFGSCKVGIDRTGLC